MNIGQLLALSRSRSVFVSHVLTCATGIHLGSGVVHSGEHFALLARPVGSVLLENFNGYSLDAGFIQSRIDAGRLRLVEGVKFRSGNTNLDWVASRSRPPNHNPARSVRRLPFKNGETILKFLSVRSTVCPPTFHSSLETGRFTAPLFVMARCSSGPRLLQSHLRCSLPTSARQLVGATSLFGVNMWYLVASSLRTPYRCRHRQLPQDSSEPARAAADAEIEWSLRGG